MARMDSFVEYTLELLEPLGPVLARRMFGGWGLYSGGRMFGLIIQDRLYLKTDDTTRSAFESAGGEPFVYDSGRGKPVTMSYWTPPPDASDDSLLLLPWARRAVDAALRAAQMKPAAKKSAPAKRPPAEEKPTPVKAKPPPGKKRARAEKPAAKRAPAPERKKTARPSRRA